MIHRGKCDFLYGVVVGAVVGTVGTLFLAPKSGEDLRSMVGDQTQRVKESTTEQMDSLKDTTTDYMNIAKDKASEFTESIQDMDLKSQELENDDTHSAHEEFAGVVEGAMDDSEDMES